MTEYVDVSKSKKACSTFEALSADVSTVDSPVCL